MTTTLSEPDYSPAQVPFKIWADKSWWDEEPDRFSMRVNNAEGDPEMFLVVSGHSTWLNLTQAREVREHLNQCIALMEEAAK